MEDLRKQLDEIDQQMRDLFEARLDVVSEVAQYKIKNNIAVLDSSREAIIIERGLNAIKNDNYKQYYKQFLDTQLDVSKQWQEAIIKNDNSK